LSETKTEKRSVGRVRLTAKVPVLVETSRRARHAVTRDVSPQGVFLYLDSQVARGTELEMLLPIPSAPGRDPDLWVRCKCRVVRVEPTPGREEFGVAVVIEEFVTVPQAVAGE